ncbi:unnamed protein product [Bubo scandiacus]
MGAVVRTAVFVMALSSCNGSLLDLSGVHQVKGTWMGSTTLPCTYMPSEGFTEQTLRWSVERDDSTATVFRRDDSGDHVLLSRFRDRVSVPKHSPGNASLLIENLEIPDSGHYTCQVVWRSKNNSLITKEVTTTVKIVKVAATKPVVRASEPGLTLPAGASTSLTCVASGSPPHQLPLVPGCPGGESPAAEQPGRAGLGQPAALRHRGVLLRGGEQGRGRGRAAERRRRADGQRVPRDAAAQPGVRPAQQPPGHPPRPCGPASAHRHTHTHTRTPPPATVTALPPPPAGPPRDAPAPLLPALAAALGGAALGALLAAVLCRRRNRAEPVYEVAFHSTADVARVETDVEVPVKCLLKETNSKTKASNDTFTMRDNGHDSICTKKNPEYENLVTAMESEYEIERI